MLCAKFGWNWLVGSREDFNHRQCIFTILLLSPLGKERGPSFEQTWITFTQVCFVPSLVEIGSVVLEKKTFLISSMYFHYVIIISPLGRAWSFILTNLNFLSLRDTLCQVWLHWPSGSGEEDENVKRLQTDGRTDRRRTTGDQKSSIEL